MLNSLLMLMKKQLTLGARKSRFGESEGGAQKSKTKLRPKYLTNKVSLW